jgi:HAE1 family hydrophobic/amphiphilic exporter-1
MKLTEFAVRRPVTMVMIAICMVVLGVVSLNRLPLEQLPEISSSGITVTADYPSSSPEEVERLIARPLEETLATMGNVDRISTTSGQTGATIRVDFVAGTDMDLANMEIREYVDRARGLLPADLDRIRIRRWQSDQRPILYVSMAWRGDGDRLLDIVQKVVEPRLLRIDGVVNVAVRGVQEKQLIVELNQEQLETHDVALQALGRQLQRNNVNVSIGRIRDGDQRYLARVLGEFTHTDEIGKLPVRGGAFQLDDLGEVKYDYPERKSFDRLNGVDAVTVQVYKSSAANVVEVAAQVRTALAKIGDQYGSDLDIEIVRDRAESVLGELNNLKDAAFLGALLAVGIIYLFLRNIRSTLVIGIAIPTAALCVFTGMYVAREFFESTITLNMVSMMGLMLAVGMLVDPAVVCLESIFRRRQEEGQDARSATLTGSNEVGMAVLASGLTTMCVFIPFFFLSTGRVSTWMRDAGMTICLAIAVSMIVALTLIPLATSRLFADRLPRLDPWIKRAIAVAAIWFFAWKVHQAGWQGSLDWVSAWVHRIAGSFAAIDWVSGAVLGVSLVTLAVLARYMRRHGMRQSYVRLLGWTLHHRLVTLMASVGLLGSGVYLYLQIEQRGTPWTPERRVDITVEIDRSYGLDDVAKLFSNIESVILSKNADLDIESLSTNFQQRRGSITARLVDADAGRLTSMEAGRAIRALLPAQIGVTYKLGRQRSWAGPLLGVEVQLKGHDPQVLEVLVEEVQERLEGLGPVQDVDSSLEDGDEEILVEIDRAQALEYGHSPQEVATTIATALGTRRTSSFKAPQREIGIVLQLREQDRSDLFHLQNSRVGDSGDNPVQLASLANFTARKGPKDLKREDRQRNVTVFANTESRRQAFQLMGTAKRPGQLTTEMSTMELPPGYSWDLGRSARWAQQDSQENNFTLLFALLLIYLIMASLFESLIHPFTIMLAIPFSLIGVALGLYAFSIPLDNNAILGLLILFGIVVNNGIVLIDHINQYRRQGMSRYDAIIRGGQNRMRPILMTAFTTILNLMPLVVPMVYGTAEGFSRRWGPVGLVVVCGLASSTLLTLVFAPTLYSLTDDLALWLRRVIRTARA